jgi:hypothetical protein
MAVSFQKRLFFDRFPFFQLAYFPPLTLLDPELISRFCTQFNSNNWRPLLGKVSGGIILRFTKI